MDAVNVIDTALLAAGGYLFFGLLFAPIFLLWGAPRLAPRMRGASLAARLFVLPGTLLLWPFLVMQWWRHRRSPPVVGDAHRTAATAHEAP